MAWFRVALSAEQQAVVNAERDTNPDPLVRRKMLTIWLLHCGLTRDKAAEVTDTGRATVQRYVASFRQGGLEALLSRPAVPRPVSDLAAHSDAIRAEFESRPVRTIAEACDRVESLTGVRRQPTQVRVFLKGLGLKWQRVRAIPIPPKKT
jgi:transposase